MQKLILVFSILFLANFSITAQISNDELARLHKHLNLPSSTLIIPSKSSKLPAKSTLKLYIAAERSHNRFVKWVDKWNRKEGKTKGSIDIVADALQADIIIAQYAVPEDISVARRTTVGVGPVFNPGTLKTQTKPTINSRLYIPKPLYSYLIIRAPDSLLIVYRDEDRSHYEDHIDPDGNLQNEFEKLIKSR